MKMKLLISIFFLSFIVSSCEKKDGFSDQFDFMYGDWQVESIYTMSLPPEAIFEVLRLNHPNHYSIIVQNSSVDAGNFEFVVESNEKLNLVFKSKSRSENYHPPVGFHNTDIKVNLYGRDSIYMYNLITDNGHFASSLIKK